MRNAECGTSKAFSRKDAKACLFSGFDRQAVKESNRGGREENAELGTRNAECGRKNNTGQERNTRAGDSQVCVAGQLVCPVLL